MKKFMIGLVAAALLPLSVSVVAKDLCLLSGEGAYFKFKAVKSLKPVKNGGKAVPLIGLVTGDGMSASVSGAAMVQANGVVNYGVTVYFGDIGGNSVVAVSGADASLAGDGAYLNDGNPTKSPITLTAVDCKTLPAI